jgi:uncharacterized protein (DUF2062 family)
VRSFVRKCLVEPVTVQLTQGVSPARLALALASGAVLGIFPVLGSTTFLCAAVAVRFRLNQVAIQLANYAAYPAQLALFVPFVRVGAWIFGAPRVSLSAASVRAELSVDVVGTAARYAFVVLRAIAAWGLIAPVATAVLFFVLRAVLRRVPLPPAATTGTGSETS